MKFDNSFTLMRAKTLSYFVEVLEPLGEDEEVEFKQEENVDDFTGFH